jgi:exopolyphosphatase/guanosine-5'-triphosphate,3'-diphosphate pyrophosphatase
MILAGIDIGTNSLRLLIAQIDRWMFREIYSDRKTTRLGQGTDSTGALGREAEERSLRALEDFSENIRRYNVQHIAAMGTSALRNASNAVDFILEAKKKTGLSIITISGEEEARLTLMGVALSLEGNARTGRKKLEKALIIDIGGGSTEIIVTAHGRDTSIVSLPLGAVYLSERFIRHDPPDGRDLELMRSAIRSSLEKMMGGTRPARGSIFTGTAGTITTLASMVQGLETYDPKKINGTVLERKSIDNIVNTLGRMTLEERISIRGLDPGREDIILAGAVVTQEIMNYFGYSSLIVSDWGLREGIVLDLYERIEKKLHS